MQGAGCARNQPACLIAVQPGHVLQVRLAVGRGHVPRHGPMRPHHAVEHLCRLTRAPTHPRLLGMPELLLASEAA